MNERIAFFLHIEPSPPKVTHQEKKFGGVAKDGTPILYMTPELKSARALLKAKLAKFKPAARWTCPIQLTCHWIFPRPKSGEGKFMVRPPDTDNLQKMLKDVMTECGYWKDDAYVVREIIEKIWVPPEQRHGIAISLIDLTTENKG